MFARAIVFLVISPFVTDSLYLYNTHDSSVVEFYDCIIDSNLPYCRRPSEPILLQRDQLSGYCDHNGTVHLFKSLNEKNISLSTILHQWNSSVEKAEKYSLYLNQRQSNEVVNSPQQQYLCECQHPQTFGKHCEYFLPEGTTFDDTLYWEVEMRNDNRWEMQRVSDIVCYRTLICDSGLLCLDWRDICDGIEHCMSGSDEENCDKLEFNECEDHEYRCVNGMCISEGYFLDGEYDCLDWSDEKELYNDQSCAFQGASFECDDRMCLRNQWSCGDGQCIDNRLNFQQEYTYRQCRSLRDQFHMCEWNHVENQWTLPNGKCYRSSDYEETLLRPRNDSEKCLYFIKCVLSQGLEKNCPCKDDSNCLHRLEVPCPSGVIGYPNGALIAPYIFTFYTAVPYESIKTPDRMEIKGIIRCRGRPTEQLHVLSYQISLDLNQLEASLCKSVEGIVSEKFRYADSRTFNNRSYHFFDVCQMSNKYISAYCIRDGYKDCAYKEDEEENDRFANSCSNIQRHRFRCSEEQSTCLPVTKLGDYESDCANNRDEWWMEGERDLWNAVCKQYSKVDCEFLRQYVQTSGNMGRTNSSNEQLQLPKIPFHSYCDTFWYTSSKDDENIALCQQWWKCPENQWQCRSGQCIDRQWLLDRQWDCVDASDEQGLVFPSNYSSLHQSSPLELKHLAEQFQTLYGNQSFWKVCNFSIEYPCIRANVVDPFNLTQNRPCIGLHQIGDDRVDCAGGVDERNTLKHCLSPTMLGNSFQCSANPTCIDYIFHCSERYDDIYVQCYGYEKTSNCSSESAFTCLDGQRMTNARCNLQFDCSHGEDELFCFDQLDLIGIPLKHVKYSLCSSLSNDLYLLISSK